MTKYKRIERYPIERSALFNCQSKNRLAAIFNTTFSEITMILDSMEYKFKEIPKKNSVEMRQISIPNDALAKVQSAIFAFLKRIERPNWLISCETCKSYVDNAKYHSGNTNVVTADIKKFYDKCQREYVFLFFKEKMKCAPDIAEILTDLTTYNGGIPTGTSTSQIIAYYAYEDMFKEIQMLSENSDLLFSLYVDDMTFSGKNHFNYRYFVNQVNCILRKYGHEVKPSKIKYFNTNSFKVITGVILTPDGRIVTPNSLRKKIIKSNKALIASNYTDKQLAKKLLGYLHAARQIEPNIFNSIFINTKKALKSA